MTTGAVARELGISETAVRQHDADLAPVRASSGARLYDPARVAAFKAARAARRNTTATASVAP